MSRTILKTRDVPGGLVEYPCPNGMDFFYGFSGELVRDDDLIGDGKVHRVRFIRVTGDKEIILWEGCWLWNQGASE